MNYNMFYDLVVMEIDRLRSEDISNDYCLCKALAACYELQDYLAGVLGEMVSRGKISDMYDNEDFPEEPDESDD